MSFSASLSGLFANQQKLNVIGNNLANMNTVAFKASTVAFNDLVSQSVGGNSTNPLQVGLGVSTGAISPNFKQGGIEDTGVSTNVAIQGSGFFVVGDASSRSYTRAGNFSFDANGMLVTTEGIPVQGYTATDPITGEIITSGAPSNIIVPPGVLRPPAATTQIGAVTNLNSNAQVNDTFSSSVQVYDTLGVAHVATITYTNTASGAWDYSVTVPGEDISGGTAGTPYEIANGNLTFDGNGKLDQVNGAAAADVTITGPTWANGATATDVTWDLIDANGVASLSGFAAQSATSSITQNGFAPGSVDSISINANGEIIGNFGTLRSVSIGVLAIANFNNPQGLVKIGSNRFSESEAAGQANIGVAGTGGRGTLVGNSLEQSNVDIAQEFTQMILAQRGYQASSKSITVADELLLETLNLKR